MTIPSRRFVPSRQRLAPWLLTFSIALAGPLTTADAQQDPKSIPRDPEVQERVTVLEEVGKDRKFEQDARGTEAIDFLIPKIEKGLNPKDQKEVVKALDSLLNRGKVRPPKRAQIYLQAAEALGRLGEAGAKVLRKAYEGKRMPDRTEWVPVRERLLLNIGRTKDDKAVKFLLDEARRSPESALQAAAGRALGHFAEADEKVRKEIVGDLLVKYGSLSERASQMGANIDAQNAKERLAAVEGPWNETLAKLTRQNFSKFREWQSWHNKHRNSEWK